LQNKSTVWLDELRKERLQSSSRNPGIAALMSFLVMGLGQIYAGHVDRGIMLLAIHLTSIFSAVSIYSRGLLYEAISPVMSTQALVVACYVFCVGYILLWIYNIKDAYYLSLFSSFRDWFEVERVLLPMLKVQSDNLLAAPAQEEHLLDNHSTIAPATAKQESTAEDADFIEVAAHTVAEPARSVADSSQSETSAEKDEAEKEVFYADVDPVSFDGQSWKLYIGLALIFILVGLWFQKEPELSATTPGPEPETLFAMAGDMPDPELVKQIKEAAPSSEVVMLANQAANIETTFVASESMVEEKALKKEEADEVVAKAFFLKGMEEVSRGDYAAACAEFEKDLLQASPDKDTWIIILNAFYRAENKLAYELKLRKFLEDFPKDASAWFNLGKILYDRQEFAQAAQALVQGLKYEPDNVRGNFLLGSIYTDLKLFDDASVYLKRAVEFEPLNLEFVFELAQSLHFAGNFTEAAKYYQRVLSLDPAHSGAINGIKELNAGLNSDSPVSLAGVPDEEKVVIIQGKKEARVMARSESSGVLYQDEDTGQNDFSVREPDGTVLFEAEPVTDVEEQVSDTKLVQSQEPGKAVESEISEKVAVARADKINNQSVKTELKQTKNEAVVIVENAKVLDPKDSAAGGKASVQLQTEPPKMIEISRNAGISSIEAGLQEKEEQGIDESMMNAVALESVGSDQAFEAIRKSAFSEYSKGNWERSLPLYLEYLKKKPDPRAYDVVSIIFEKLHMANDAFEASEHAYKMGLQELPTLIRLGRLAEETQRYGEGEKYLKMALQKSPHRIDLRIRYARCLAMNGQSETAISELESIAQDNSSSYSVKTRVENEIKQIRKN
jgi:tetratricopeptide (TPR) repeat protein